MIGIKKQDFEELYQLLKMYESTYGSDLAKMLLLDVAERYSSSYGGESISEKRNPRRAGRKKQYTDETKDQIRHLRDEGMTIRMIADKTGCSIGYVQGVLSKP